MSYTANEVAVLYFWEQHHGWQYSIASKVLRRTGWLFVPQSASDEELLRELKKWEPGFYGTIDRSSSPKVK